VAKTSFNHVRSWECKQNLVKAALSLGYLAVVFTFPQPPLVIYA